MSRVHEAIEKAALAAGGSVVPDLEIRPTHAEPRPNTMRDGEGEFQPAEQPAAEAEVVGVPAKPSPSSQGVQIFRGFSADVEEKVVSGTIEPLFLEQYRKLASTLHQSQVERDIRVVMVTSAMAREGKTLTASNLALTLADSFHREVLLIDADLRRPNLHEVFNLPNVSGLADCLRSDSDQKLPVFQVGRTLKVLPAGRPEPNPMSLLVSDRMRRVVDEARQQFDWVIIDTPPLALIPDGHLLGMLVDVALLVVAAGETQLPAIESVVAGLGREKVIGVVLNRIDPKVAGLGTYSYDYYTTASGRG